MKILLSKPGLDGHDVGVKVLAHALINNGFEVAYTGLRKSTEEIVRMAVETQADAVGLSILSGTHVILCRQMKKDMNATGLNIPMVIGGNIPVQDIELLIQEGATAAFPTGTKVETVVDYFKKLIPEK